jgi:DNA-binding transcriptional LysR family regulator
VQDVLQRLQSTLAPQAFDPRKASTSFVLTMADATAAELMTGLVDVVTQQAPGVSLRVVPLTTRDPRKTLDEGHVDLAIGHFPAVIADLTARAQSGQPMSFLHHQLFASDYVCVMRKGHPLAQGPLTLERYCEAPHLLVSFSGRAFGFIDEALRAMERSRKVVLTVNQFFTAGKVVANSDLLTVLPRHFVHVTGFADQLVLRELPLKVAPIQVGALWHQRQQGSSAHVWLRDQVVAVAASTFPP